MIKKEKMEYTVFDADTIREQFDRIRKELTEDMSSEEINKQFHKILVNRIFPSLTYDKTSPNMIVYRVTKFFDGFDETMRSSYSYPPNPSVGRANLVEKPVLYTSLDPVSAVTEMKNSIAFGEKFYISKWEICFNKDVIAHWLIINSTTISSKEVIGEISNEQRNKLGSIVQKIPKKFQEGFLLSIEELGNLYSAPGNKLYHITSAYSHHLLYNARDKNVFIDMLVYPSVENSQTSINLAIHPNLVDGDQMQLKEVYEVSILENTLKTEENGHVKLDIHKRGVFRDGTLTKWEVPTFDITGIDFESLELKTYNKSLLKGEEASLKIINNGQSTVKDWLTQSINSEQIRSKAFKVVKLEDFNFPLENTVFVQDIEMHTTLNHGNEIETPNGRSCIQEVRLPFKVRMWYREQEISRIL